MHGPERPDHSDLGAIFFGDKSKLDCIGSRKKPNASVEFGHRISRDVQPRLNWDPMKEKSSTIPKPPRCWHARSTAPLPGVH